MHQLEEHFLQLPLLGQLPCIVLYKRHVKRRSYRTTSKPSLVSHTCHSDITVTVMNGTELVLNMLRITNCLFSSVLKLVVKQLHFV